MKVSLWYLLVAFFIVPMGALAQSIPDGPLNAVNMAVDTSDGSDLSWAEFQASVKHEGNFTIITPSRGCIGVIKLPRVDIQESKMTDITFRNGKILMELSK